MDFTGMTERDGLIAFDSRLDSDCQILEQSPSNCETGCQFAQRKNCFPTAF